MLAHGSFGDVAWSPDGRQIAYTDECLVRHDAPGEWYCNSSTVTSADGLEPHRLPIRATSVGDWIKWIPHRTDELIWGEYPDAIRITNLSTGRTATLTRLIVDAHVAGMSSDGNDIAILSQPSFPSNSTKLLIHRPSGQVVQRVPMPTAVEILNADVHFR